MENDGYYSPEACRALAAALLLRAVRDARRGDEGAVAWVLSADSQMWAETLGLERWPPDGLKVIHKAC
jgi:hypothetical protein